MLDAEFALVLYDGNTASYVAARESAGNPSSLLWPMMRDGQMIFASEAKNLVGLTERIMPFPPGHYFKDGKFICYRTSRQ